MNIILFHPNKIIYLVTRFTILNDFLNSFLNDFPLAGEAGEKIINGFLNDFPPAGGKNPKFPKITIVTTTTAGL